jgi:hypothetical protein
MSLNSRTNHRPFFLTSNLPSAAEILILFVAVQARRNGAGLNETGWRQHETAADEASILRQVGRRHTHPISSRCIDPRIRYIYPGHRLLPLMHRDSGCVFQTKGGPVGSIKKLGNRFDSPRLYPSPPGQLFHRSWGTRAGRGAILHCCREGSFRAQLEALRDCRIEAEAFLNKPS